MGRINAGKNAIGIDVLNWVNTVDRQIFPVCRCKRCSISSAPVKVAKALIGRGGGLELTDHFTGAERANTGSRNLAKGRLQVHPIGIDSSIRVAVVYVLGSMELR